MFYLFIYEVMEQDFAQLDSSLWNGIDGSIVVDLKLMLVLLVEWLIIGNAGNGYHVWK